MGPWLQRLQAMAGLLCGALRGGEASWKKSWQRRVAFLMASGGQREKESLKERS